MGGMKGCATVPANYRAVGKIAAFLVIDDATIEDVELGSNSGVNLVTATPSNARYPINPTLPQGALITSPEGDHFELVEISAGLVIVYWDSTSANNTVTSI